LDFAAALLRGLMNSQVSRLPRKPVALLRF
jgi:hypothetical protein